MKWWPANLKDEAKIEGYLFLIKILEAFLKILTIHSMNFPLNLLIMMSTHFVMHTSAACLLKNMAIKLPTS